MVEGEGHLDPVHAPPAGEHDGPGVVDQDIQPLVTAIELCG
jgi:hypothetical protein